MKIKKQLFTALGPFIVASILLGIILFSPFDWFQNPSDRAVENAASSMSVNVFKGNILKNSALASEHYLPFFGSSELSRINSFHPSSLAKKYHPEYEPFLLGAPGTQSLTHFFMLDSMKNELKDRPIVFIISPQWFVKNGIGDPAFSAYCSPLQIYQWLSQLDEVTEDEQYLAKRLLSFSSIQSDATLRTLLNKVESGQTLSRIERKNCSLHFNFLEREDQIFSSFGIKSNEKRIKKSINLLPEQYDFHALDQLAFKMGEEHTTNNEFEITNSFYTKRIAPSKEKLKGSQTEFDYVQSPEFSDFQLILKELATNNIHALFVIPPVNEKWSDYTGLSEDMLNTFSVKIKEQLESQGFNNIADFTQKRSENYFMEDTIHLGWRGWLELDQYLQEFLTTENDEQHQLNSQQFLSTEWQEKKDF